MMVQKISGACPGNWGAVLALVLGCLCACTQAGAGLWQNTGGTGGEPWTFIVYMAADNDLETQALADLNELEAACIAGLGHEVLVLLDRSPGHDTSNGDWTGTRCFRVGNDWKDSADLVSRELDVPELGLVAGQGGELNMGTPAALRGMINFAQRKYGSERTGLVLWGHGTGWRGGTALARGAFRGGAWDEGDNDWLDTMEIAMALEDIGGVDLLVQDTCYGTSLEQALELAPHASFQIGSPGAIPAEGLDYGGLAELFCLPVDGPSAMAELWLGLAAASWGDGTSVALVDGAGILEVLPAFQAWTAELSAALSTPELRDALRESFWDAVPGWAEPDDWLAKDLASLVGAAAIVCPGHGAGASLITALGGAVRVAGPGAGVSVLLVPLAAGLPCLDFGGYDVRNADPVPRLVAEGGWAPDSAAGTGLLYRLWLEVYP